MNVGVYQVDRPKTRGAYKRGKGEGGGGWEAYNTGYLTKTDIH